MPILFQKDKKFCGTKWKVQKQIKVYIYDIVKVTSQISRENIYYLINDAGTISPSFGGKIKVHTM